MTYVHAPASDVAIRSAPHRPVGSTLERRTLRDHISAPSVNGNFAELFRLFVIAAAHEVLNSVLSFTYCESDPADIREKALKVIKSFKRLEMLSIVAQGMAGFYAAEHFSEEEWLRMGPSITLAPLVSDRKYRVDPQAVRQFGLEEVRSFRIALFDFASTVEGQMNSIRAVLKPNFSRAVRLGKFLSNTLEKLMQGNLDLDDELEKKPVCNISVLCTNLALSCGLNVNASSALAPEYSSRLVSFNPMFIALIISNISSNAKLAMEFTGTDAVLDLTTTVCGSFVRFEFADKGCGMPEEVVSSINAGIPISTKTPTVNPDAEQHGIGFAYCRLLAEKMGGKLYVSESHQNGPQRGSKIVLELPISVEGST